MGLLDWLQDPRRTQAMQGIGSAIQSGLLNIQQGNQRFQDLQQQAFADQKNPARVTNPQAMNELAKMGMGLLSFAPVGLTVFHGSPAKFQKFDPTKIGSGEGAQAYGYGHYVAESPAVAKEYRTALSEPELFVKGRQIKTTAGSNMDTAKAWLQDSFEMGAKNPYADAIEKVSNAPLKDKQGVIDALKKLETRGVQMQKGGFEYKIDLPDEQIAKMLDYDKPIKDQPEVLKAIRNQIQDEDIAKSFDINVKSGISGANAYQNYVYGKTPAEKAEILRQAGVPGIRYLDQGSRGTGQGTSNFVVFPGNEDLLRILERNNQPLSLLD